MASLMANGNRTRTRVRVRVKGRDRRRRIKARIRAKVKAGKMAQQTVRSLFYTNFPFFFVDLAAD
jgi:hypothetical protein